MLERPPTPRLAAWKWLALAGGLLVYLRLFYGAHDDRWQSLLLALVPDDIGSSWVGGNRQQLQLLDRLPLLLVASLLLATAFLAGQATLRLLRCDRVCSTAEQIVFALGVGLSELSLSTLALGLCGILRQRWLFIVLIGAIWAASAWRWKRGAFASFRCRSQPVRQGTPWLDRYGLWLAMPFVALLLLGGMLPPWEFDVREYHLQVPKEWFLQGKIDFLPHNVYGNMPLGAELPALLAMTLMPGEGGWWWGALIGKTVIACFALPTAGGLLAAGQRFATKTAGVVAALVYLSTPWITYISVTGLIDGAVGFYLLLAFYAFAIGKSEAVAAQADGDRWMWLAGFLAGSAAACKYPGFVFVVAPLFLAVLFWRWTVNWKPAVCFLLAMVCGCGLWLAKNWWFTGNPVYPLLCGGTTRTVEKLEQWNRAHRVPRDAAGHSYSLPQVADAIATVGWRSSGLSPLLVPLAVLAFVSRKRRRIAWILGGLLAYLVATWWLFSHRLERFLVPALPVAALLAGCGAAWSTSRPWRAVLIGILVAGLMSNLLYSLSSPDQDHRYLVALEQLRRDEPAKPNGTSRVERVHRYLNDIVPADATVLLVGDAQPFDLEVPVLYNTCFDDCIFELLMKNRSREERIAALRDRKISHVYVKWSEIRRYSSPGNYGFTDYVTRECIRELVEEQGILSRVDLGIDPKLGEVFEVRQLPVNRLPALGRSPISERGVVAP
ncbi:MAG: hypothetical protein NTY19_13035 [Planctomycetota bacterium]|nr:hypothetical protein [Planctomycetota bacterium]